MRKRNRLRKNIKVVTAKISCRCCFNQRKECVVIDYLMQYLGSSNVQYRSSTISKVNIY